MNADDKVLLSGTITKDSVRVLLKDKVYYLNQQLVVQGTLIIEPGTRVEFYDNGRILVGTGGRLIADGFAKLAKHPRPSNLATTTQIVAYWTEEGYADMRCFLFPFAETNKLQVQTSGLDALETKQRERTISPLKYNTIFNVAINTQTRSLVNIADPTNPFWPAPAEVSVTNQDGTFSAHNLVAADDPNIVVVPYETAMMFMAARMDLPPASNVQLKMNDWTRADGSNVNITPATITFIGQPQNNMSREWGHIVVMPGARAAFFRNCEFSEFKKDTTVDNKPYYTNADLPNTLSPQELILLNDKMLSLSNGGGGVITTFSSRTWLVDCNFHNNFARNRGGAVQILQTPTAYFYPQGSTKITTDTLGIARFDFSENQKNTKVTDVDKYYSTVLTRDVAQYNRYPMIDRIDEPVAEDAYFINDTNRMAWDDARLAGYLGRFRNLTFKDNMVRLAETYPIVQGATVIKDDTNKVAEYPMKWGNMAYGGALYIAGTPGDKARQLEFTLGLNDAIRLGANNDIYNPNVFANSTGNFRDYVLFQNNVAQNLQKDLNTDGAKGGAIYVGDNTSLIVAGEFINNHTDAKYLVDYTGEGTYTNNVATPYINGLLYSNGGAIYSDPSFGRLQVRGSVDKDAMRTMTNSANPGPERPNATTFTNNAAGAGGAIFVNNGAQQEPLFSPQIGGSDEDAVLNNNGWKILFNNNTAWTAGGAIYTNRNMDVTGAGGATRAYQYSQAHLVRFVDNNAGFAGGAIHVEIPIGSIDIIPGMRVVDLRRAEFVNNTVNKLPYINPDHVNNDINIQNQVRGGGAIYTLWADPNVVRAVNFEANKVYNGNGGAMAIVNPHSKTERLFVTDLDRVYFAPIPAQYTHLEGLPQVAIGYTSVNNPFTYGAYTDANEKYTVTYPDEYSGSELLLGSNMVKQVVGGMLNRFNENSAFVDEAKGQNQIENYGNTQITKGYIMPNANLTSQHWFTADNAIIAGNGGSVIKVNNNNNVITWSERYNDSLWGTRNLTDMVFPSANSGYIADNYGNIYKTSDQGGHWVTKHITIDAVESINDIAAISGAYEQVLAVTSQGRIYRSVDGGNIWTNNGNPFPKVLNGATWVSGTTAYIVGSEGTIARSSDGGTTWVAQLIQSLNKDLYKVAFKSAYVGFAIGDQGTFVRTTDGGATWNIVTGIFPTTEKLISVAIYGQDIVYVGTNHGLVYKSTDGGNNWNLLGKNFGSAINSIFIYDANTVMVAGDGDLLWKSTDGGDNWITQIPTNISKQVGNPRLHGGIANLVENGIGLGGALYILDFVNDGVAARTDSIKFNRNRFTDNFAFTGSVVYSDNFNLKLFFNRSLIRGNKTDLNNTIGADQNAINGPLNRDPQYVERNYASSDLASATIYGEIQGPFPSSKFSTLANSIFENDARFLIRLPDAPNTKGIMEGQPSTIGTGGIDTLIGNYWGKTEANVYLTILNLHQDHTGGHLNLDKVPSFFVEKVVRGEKLVADKNYLPFYNVVGTDLRRQGPFEYNTSDYQGSENNSIYTYRQIELNNADLDQENTPADFTIPEKYLFSFDIYDLHDKGTDIKTADYSKRRMFPIEDFAVGNPIAIYLDDPNYVDQFDQRTNTEVKEKYVRRLLRNPEYADAIAGIDANKEPIYVDPILHSLQGVWAPKVYDSNLTDPLVPRYYHPIGLPIYLEAKARTLEGDYNATNRDIKHQASTVFFVINENTQDYIRVELKQVPESYNEAEGGLWAGDVLRTTVFLVPDSTNRNSAELRRDKENLRNLGTNGKYPFGGENTLTMLKKLSPRYDNINYAGIEEAALNEDYAALIGRKYQVNSTNYRDYNPGAYFNMGGTNPLFFNRPLMPEDNDVIVGAQTESKTTYFAGERYGTLPANVGDVIRVVSRNVLWRQGFQKAYDGGLVFIVESGIQPPLFTGDVNMYNDSTGKLNPYISDKNGNFPIYRNDRVDENGNYTENELKNYELLNKVWVHTDREYPATKGLYSNPNLPDNVRGTDVILSVTANDLNNFVDPRYMLLPGDYTSLIYTWEYANRNNALRHWLMVDTIRQEEVVNGEIVRGYLNFKGFPINPYIVPGGEAIRVGVANYAGQALIDSLKASHLDNEVAKYYQTFPPYLFTPYYNEDQTGEPDMTARFLQQDSLGIYGNKINSHDLTIFVMDSLPRFIPDETDPYRSESSVYGKNFKIKKGDENKVGDTCNVYAEVPYEASFFQAGRTYKDATSKVLVNLAEGFLRFKMDINTDDELEDATAEVKGWDFRYGRTAYTFGNVGTLKGDSLVVDTLSGNKDDYHIIAQLRPSWMMSEYMYRYANNDVLDDYLMDFNQKGQINLRIPEAEALELLLRHDVENRIAYNTDTLMAIVANDGHGGISTKFIDLYVNFQPKFTTTYLPNATEGQEYNMKRDSISSIRIFDANADQTHTYMLIYKDEPAMAVVLDPSFPEETTKSLVPYKTTPEWLKIEPISGILYGTPGTIRDMKDTLVTVSVLVMDEDGLANIDTFHLRVATGNCVPEISIPPVIECLVSGQTINEELTVFDRDLIRDNGDVTRNERLTLTVVNPASGLTVEPSVITGVSADSMKVYLKNTGSGFTYNKADLIAGNRLPVSIKVTDRAGASSTIDFNIRVSDEVVFAAEVNVENSIGHNKTLIFGTAADATTGDALDGKLLGGLDEKYCEIEIPPLPNQDVFDARWSIPEVNGTYRNIFPTATHAANLEYRYRGVFQAGGVTNSASPNYPVTISWNPKQVPAIGAANNPYGSTWRIIDGISNGNYFSVNMSNVADNRRISSNVSFEEVSDDLVKIVILDNRLTNFHIIHNWGGFTGIDDTEDNNYTTAILGVNPAPLTADNQEGTLKFEVSKSGNVLIEMFDVLGNKVCNIVDGYYTAGQYSVNFNVRDFSGSKLSSGSYNIRMLSGTTPSTFSLIIVAQ
ncbi:MAG: hypothetical protein LBO69_01110 [Ignavibacteria bacterium]|nr:hypothetical protein [Ignavibacteria bacterium]